MSTAPGVPGITLSRPELAHLAINFAKLTGDDAATLVAIAHAESRGVTNAYRPASKNPSGGDDRGVLQWNSKAHPDISDADAYNPVRAFAIAGTKIAAAGGGIAGMGAWNVGPKAYSGRERGDLDLTAARNAVASPVNPLQRIIGAGLLTEIGTIPAVLDAAGSGASTVVDAATGVLDWTLSLGTLLARLIDPTWWQRIGVGALGVAAVIAAIVITTRSTAS
jgi:hypothetical protein